MLHDNGQIILILEWLPQLNNREPIDVYSIALSFLGTKTLIAPGMILI